MKHKIIGSIGVLAATAAISVALPSGMAWAADAHHTDTKAMPGGAGTVTCITDYDVSSSGASVKPISTRCKNSTSRTLKWDSSEYIQANHSGAAFSRFEPRTAMAPGGTYSLTWPTSAPWKSKSIRPLVETVLSHDSSGSHAVLMNFMYP